MNYSEEQNMTPLFAYLLVDDQQMTPAAEGGTNPTYYCYDIQCTKKYPSDDDECSTFNPYCDTR